MQSESLKFLQFFFTFRGLTLSSFRRVIRLPNLGAVSLSVMRPFSKAVTGAALFRKMLVKTGAQFYKKVRVEKTLFMRTKSWLVSVLASYKKAG